jgi:type IV pilus assembly protein PilA
MHNPYATTPGVAPSTPEAQLQADYEAAIGPNTGYYLSKFEAFDAGQSKASWHWPAFFVTSCWFLYRKMWLPGLLNLAYPFILSFVLGIAFGVAKPPIPVMVGLSLVLLVLPSILLPIFANAIYWRHIHNLIDGLPGSVAQVPEKRMGRLERNGGTGAGAMVAVIVGGGFFFIFIVGILAAIAIPAYQDYTIRAQISEGLNLSSGAKAAVAEYFAAHNAWPENAAAAGVTPASGKYVQSVDIENGSVVIIYGAAANTQITGKTLILLPGRTAKGDVVWACANVQPDGVVEFAPGRYGTDLVLKYLPQRCRTGTPISRS